MVRTSLTSSRALITSASPEPCSSGSVTIRSSGLESASSRSASISVVTIKASQGLLLAMLYRPR